MEGYYLGLLLKYQAQAKIPKTKLSFDWTGVQFPRVRRVFGKLLAEEIVGRKI